MLRRSGALSAKRHEEGCFRLADRTVVPAIAGGLEQLRDLAVRAKLSGPRIHDARIAALCLHHGVRELWTADRDFSAFPKLKTRNPLVNQ